MIVVKQSLLQGFQKFQNFAKFRISKRILWRVFDSRNVEFFQSLDTLQKYSTVSLTQAWNCRKLQEFRKRVKFFEQNFTKIPAPRRIPKPWDVRRSWKKPPGIRSSRNFDYPRTGWKKTSEKLFSYFREFWRWTAIVTRRIFQDFAWKRNRLRSDEATP